ncbi:GIY-YIG nuclease family protein [Cecembia calidifontis]|uniref:Putative endonuclease n=1 Tax=Cecembia calidifontis TaxID=1187080 RepID=A0A4V2F613_9BACT|nr:GIY-YIG nuclease family protein [Cecembia calidifontis]RZS94719.1 putative endonuclease [Cecembia calidifontis]
MYFVYILYSSKTDKFYIGSTDDLESRLKHHNYGATPSTKSGAPNWRIVHKEILPDKSSALKRELEINSKIDPNKVYPFSRQETSSEQVLSFPL